ncbi:MAG: HEAT repeat domain-containing protein [Cyanobacteriota bacterium]|nr:HEAT repeat domain-containing protein [Cyanobacteriota bacterium]
MSDFLMLNEEEEEFKKVLNILVNPQHEDNNYDLKRIFLFDGNRDTGKTALLKRLREISQQEPYTDKFNHVFIDWQDKYDKNIKLRVGIDNIKPITVMDAISNEFQESFREFSQMSSDYQDQILSWKQVEEKGNLPEKEELEKLNAPETLVDLVNALGEGISNLVKEQKKPLLIFFDTYEFVGSQKCDFYIRRLIKAANALSKSIIWVIAGRLNLVENTRRNQKVELALLEALKDEDGDVVKVAIDSLMNYKQALQVEQLTYFLLENRHQDRYVRKAAVSALQSITYSNIGHRDLQLAVRAIVETVRKDEISNVRDAASESLQAIYDLDIVKEQLKKHDPSLDTTAYRTKIREEGKYDSNEILHEYLGDKDFSKLEVSIVKSLLRNEDPDVRTAAVKKLGEMASSINETLVQELIKLLDFNNKDSDRYLREAVVETLGKLAKSVPTEEILDSLNEAYRQDVIRDVRDAAKGALEEIEKQDSEMGKLASHHLELMDFSKLLTPTMEIETAIEILTTDEETERQVKAALALGSCQQPEVVGRATEVLTKVLKDENQNQTLVAAAANSLGKIGNSLTLESLLSKLKELEGKDWVARKYVIEALEELLIDEKYGEQVNLEKVIEVLINKWRNDPISYVRDAVEKAIKEVWKATRNPTAYEAINRYSSEDNKEFFQEYPPQAEI